MLSFSGSQSREKSSKTDLPAQSNTGAQEGLAAAPEKKKIVDINQPQTCKNKGCGMTFKEIDNHDTACSYHPGPAVFHDRLRGVGYVFYLTLHLKFRYRLLFTNYFDFD